MLLILTLFAVPGKYDTGFRDETDIRRSAVMFPACAGPGKSVSSLIRCHISEPQNPSEPEMLNKDSDMNENNGQEYVKIAVLESIVEAQIVSSFLKEEEIPHLILSYHDTAYDGLYQFQKGWGEIRGLLSQKEEIVRILDDVRAENYDLET